MLMENLDTIFNQLSSISYYAAIQQAFDFSTIHNWRGKYRNMVEELNTSTVPISYFYFVDSFATNKLDAMFVKTNKLIDVLNVPIKWRDIAIAAIVPTFQNENAKELLVQAADKLQNFSLTDMQLVSINLNSAFTVHFLLATKAQFPVLYSLGVLFKAPWIRNSWLVKQLNNRMNDEFAILNADENNLPKDFASYQDHIIDLSGDLSTDKLIKLYQSNLDYLKHSIIYYLEHDLSFNLNPDNWSVQLLPEFLTMNMALLYQNDIKNFVPITDETKSWDKKYLKFNGEEFLKQNKYQPFLNYISNLV